MQSIVCDESNGRLIMFGGIYAESPVAQQRYMNDTWSYDLDTNTWTELKPKGTLPCPRYGQCMVWDPDAERVLMFGGTGEASATLTWPEETNESDGDCGDLWAYDPVADAWIELEPSGPLPPGGLYQRMVYDTRTHRVLLVANTMKAGASEDTTLLQATTDLWAYDPQGNAWTRLEPEGAKPAGRLGSLLTYDSDTGMVLIFGGISGSLDTGDAGNDSGLASNVDLWAYDPVKNRWHELQDSFPLKDLAPDDGGRFIGLGEGYFAFLAGMHRSVLLVPMVSEKGKLYSQMWAYDAEEGQWARLQPAGGFPQERDGGSIVYCPNHDSLALFGGMRGEKPNDPFDPNQAWRYYGEVWIYRASTATAR
jgi:hypothetical protein